MVNLNKLKALAKKNGIKQKELFEMVGRKEWFGGDIKKGVSVPYSYLETWANALHTTPAYLMDETDDPAEAKQNQAGTGLYRYWKALSRMSNTSTTKAGNI